MKDSEGARASVCRGVFDREAPTISDFVSTSSLTRSAMTFIPAVFIMLHASIVPTHTSAAEHPIDGAPKQSVRQPVRVTEVSLPDTLLRRYVSYADAATALAERLFYEGRLDDGLQIVEAVLGILPNSVVALEPSLARTLIKKGKLLAFQSFTRNAGYEDGLTALRRAEQIAEALGLEAELAESNLFSGFLVYARAYNSDVGSYDDAMPFFQRAWRLREKIGDQRGVAEAHIYIGIIHERKGDDATAIEHYQQALDISTAGDYKLEKSYATRHLAFPEAAKGNLEEALALFEESLALREAIGFKIYLPFSYLSVGETLAELGQPAEALGHYQNALRLAGELSARRVQVLCLLAIGQAQLQLDAGEEATDAFTRAARISKEIGYERGVERASAGLETVGRR
jgi:tetratricopeptide (TPR) repeat protein